MVGKMLVSRDAFAQMLGVQLRQIQRYVARGLPVERDGINPDEAVSWIVRHVYPQTGRNSDRGVGRAWQMWRQRQVHG